MEAVKKEAFLEISVEVDDTPIYYDGTIPSIERSSCSYEYDLEQDKCRIFLDSDESAVRPSIAVIETIAALARKDSTELTPLFTIVDPDALDTLVQSPASHSERNDMLLSFTYENYTVTIQSNGD